jgi:hypothetical protein
MSFPPFVLHLKLRFAADGAKLISLWYKGTALCTEAKGTLGTHHLVFIEVFIAHPPVAASAAVEMQPGVPRPQAQGLR